VKNETQTEREEQREKIKKAEDQEKKHSCAMKVPAKIILEIQADNHSLK